MCERIYTPPAGKGGGVCERIYIYASRGEGEGARERIYIYASRGEGEGAHERIYTPPALKVLRGELR